MLAIIALILIPICFILYELWRYRNSGRGAPFVPMEPEIVERVLQIADVGAEDIVYDLGSGDGRIPLMAALKRNARAVGVEIDKFNYWFSRARSFIMRLDNQVTFINKDFFEVDLSPATVVVLYLLQETNESLMEKLATELQPGTRIVSAAFDFPGWEPIYIDFDHPTPYGPLHLYVTGDFVEEDDQKETNIADQSEIPPIVSSP